MPTNDEIEDQIEQLHEFSEMFDASERDEIFAQITALEEELTGSDADEYHCAGEWNDNEADAAIEAIQWREGRRRQSPAEYWERRARKQLDRLEQ